METAEFWLTASRYVQQVGDHEPKFVAATPVSPVKIVLPAKIKRGDKEIDQPEDSHMKRAEPAKPKEPHAAAKPHARSSAEAVKAK